MESVRGDGKTTEDKETGLSMKKYDDRLTESVTRECSLAGAFSRQSGPGLC